MLTVFLYQVLRLLRDRVLLVWTLGFPIVLSLIFMAMFSNLDKVYEATPMSFGVVQNEAYRTAPGLDAVVQVPLDTGAFGLEGVHEGGAAGREVADLGGQLLQALLLALTRQRLHQPQPQRSEPQEHPGGEGKAYQPDG